MPNTRQSLLVGLATGGLCVGCLGEGVDPAEEESLGEAQTEFSTLTPVQEVLLTGALLRANSNTGSHDAALAAAYSNTIGQRYFFLYRDLNSPWHVRYIAIDGTNGSPTFGQKVLGPTATSCGGGTPCILASHADGATLRVSSRTDNAWFVYEQGTFELGTDGITATAGIHGLRVGANASQTRFVLHECHDQSGFPICRTYLPNADASTRGTNDRILLAYFYSPTVNANDWQIAAKLVDNNGGTQSLTNVNSCASSPCPLSGHFAHVATAYNKQADRFLVAWVEWDQAFQRRLRAQIYDGTTGALVGGTIDLTSALPPVAPVLPYDWFNDGNWHLGVASNPNSAVNPQQEWVIIARDARIHVRPDGTFSTGTLTPGGYGAAHWSFQWTNSSDGYDYERIFDFAHCTGNFECMPVFNSPVAIQRYDAAVGGGGASFAVDGTLTGFAEQLAYGRSQNAMGIWSGTEVDMSGNTIPKVRWRLFDRQ